MYFVSLNCARIKSWTSSNYDRENPYSHCAAQVTDWTDTASSLSKLVTHVAFWEDLAKKKELWNWLIKFPACLIRFSLVQVLWSAKAVCLVHLASFQLAAQSSEGAKHDGNLNTHVFWAPAWSNLANWKEFLLETGEAQSRGLHARLRSGVVALWWGAVHVLA